MRLFTNILRKSLFFLLLFGIASVLQPCCGDAFAGGEEPSALFNAAGRFECGDGYMKRTDEYVYAVSESWPVAPRSMPFQTVLLMKAAAI